MIVEKTSITLSMNHRKTKWQNNWSGDKYSQTWTILALWMHQNCRRPKQYQNWPSRRTRHSEVKDIVSCHRLGETSRIIVKLLNRKDAQNVLEENHKLRSINLYDDNTNTNNKRKIFINQSFCPYYRKLYGLVKNLNNECLIDSF